MKCRVCRGPAVIDIRRHNANFCREHFLRLCRDQVERAIRRFDMLEPGERVLVAVSGGKDSLALWDILIDLGYDADGLYLGLGIGDYSEESAGYAHRYAEGRGLTLHTVDLPQSHGFDIPTGARAAKRAPCSACGLSKRHLFDDAARRGGYDALATGHNLDDEAAVLMGNALRWQTEYLGRQLPAQVLGLPPQGIAHEHGGLVVEVVPGGEGVVAAPAGRIVEQVPLGQAAGRARRPLGGASAGGDVEAVALRQVDGVEGETPALRVAVGVAGGLLAVVADAEPQVEAVGVVAQVDQYVPKGEAVLAARHRHQHTLAGLEHVEATNGPLHLVAAQPQEVLPAEVGVVAPDVDHRRPAADPALHRSPAVIAAPDPHAARPLPISRCGSPPKRPPPGCGRPLPARRRISPDATPGSTPSAAAGRAPSPDPRPPSPWSGCAARLASDQLGLRRAQSGSVLRCRTSIPAPGSSRSSNTVVGSPGPIARRASLTAPCATNTANHSRELPSRPRRTARRAIQAPAAFPPTSPTPQTRLTSTTVLRSRPALRPNR